MSKNRVFEKLDRVNSEKEEIVFKMEYKGKVMHKTIIEMPFYSKEILSDEELSFYYFFKDMANKLEEKITEFHKKKMWDNLKGKDGSDNEENRG
jgi:hypothetical protein